MCSARVVLAQCSEFARATPTGAAQIQDALESLGVDVVQHGTVDYQFPDGERYVQIPEVDPCSRVLILQSLKGRGSAPDSALFALILAARCYREQGIRNIRAYAPVLAYGRQDRAVPGQRRPVTVRLVGDMLAAADISQLIALRVGSMAVISEALSTPLLRVLDTVSLQEELAKAQERPIDVVVAPDAGACGAGAALATRLGSGFLGATKTRLDAETVEVSLPETTCIMGKHVLIADDLVSSAGTVACTAAELRWRGAKSVALITTACDLTSVGRERLDSLHASRAIQCFSSTDAIDPGNWPDFAVVHSHLDLAVGAIAVAALE